MLQITATDLKANLGKYLSLAQSNEIHITENGKCVAMLSAPKDTLHAIDDLSEKTPHTVPDEKEARSHMRFVGAISQKSLEEIGFALLDTQRVDTNEW
ncbi:MAG: type II toxin-antitoxin system Phd/YefM family antitoxin [Clostridiales bacterium]|nr:type II toxin-antitoxin system Phd/YefM family antitoxin [Clostridiales bacterium]